MLCGAFLLTSELVIRTALSERDLDPRFEKTYVMLNEFNRFELFNDRVDGCEVSSFYT